ncbi:M1 family metallopeptidase [Sphingomonas oligoaromativorans]|uniref:M1 family metallopeptidase n=1 Tax=Sphingomonas oligoaromativorans TaxID=575322 RepID=UPI0014213493|nr:M1 family metallopeptidase [Sphingomonas oligoaromativorans]NIJ33653.1 aminopeptidase N [Sphingomonas oligoaromativorans]
MRTGLTVAALMLTPAALAAAPAPVPQGILPDTAVPTAYRLDLTVLPDQPRFSGHVEIDVTLKAPTRSLYLHGRDLKVTTALARVGAVKTAATYTQVDPLGVARVDFARPLPAGRVTLVFDYDAPFGNSPSGMYHLKIADKWYAWTQFESIDARAAYPGFDQPGYKTPFTVSLTTAPGSTAVSNAPETGVVKVGKLERHQFAPTKPLPTYLVAMMVGPFATVSGLAAPTPERAKPLPVRVVGTQPNKDQMDFALQNTGQIVGLLEKYFGRPFPFPKLDQIGSPVMPGAMENAGADTYGDSILFLDKGASTAQKQEFGMVVAHELAHQWFGDLVTPKWWDDIWLNESFANWMGYRIGNEWRPDLKIGVGAIGEAFRAMNIDALKAGRPIHQPIKTNGEIDSAFDAVTYGKGGQVVAMIAAYLGDEKFREGVRLHLNRHAYGNASTEEFFAALAEAAHDPRVLASLKSFVDQQGVPVVRVERTANGLAVSQKRYAMLGTDIAPQTWTIPLCVRVGDTRQCSLLDKASGVVPVTGTGAIMPNAGGTGYYRFSLSETEWRKLIGESASLPAGEALAMTDSLWAAYRAGEVSPSLLVAAARAMAANPYSGAVTDGGQRLSSWRTRGLISDADMPAYHALIDGIYAPILEKLGFDPKARIYASEDPDRQKLRSSIVSLLAGEAEDKAVLAKLSAAATAYLGGDKDALDQSLFDDGFAAYLSSGGDTALAALFDKAASSDDTLFRDAAIEALAGTGSAANGRWLIAHMDDKRLRPSDRLSVLRYMVSEPATRDMGFDYLVQHYDVFVKDNGIFAASILPKYGSDYCSVEKANEIEAVLRPKVEAYKRGGLSLDRAVEEVRDCGVLQQKLGTRISDAVHGR